MIEMTMQENGAQNLTEEEYDWLEAFARIDIAGKRIDPRAIEVITFHLALERELDIILARLLRRPKRVTGMGFINKAKVLHATWGGENQQADKLFAALNCFNDLRNELAHANGNFDACDRNLRVAYQAIDPEAAAPYSYGLMAQGICALMGDGMMPEELDRVAKSIERAINTNWPTAKRSE